MSNLMIVPVIGQRMGVGGLRLRSAQSELGTGWSQDIVQTRNGASHD